MHLMLYLSMCFNVGVVVIIKHCFLNENFTALYSTKLYLFMVREHEMNMTLVKYESSVQGTPCILPIN
jgi:hypothetical protein